MELTEKQLEIVNYVQSLFKEPVYLVGGAIRNALLDKPIKDYDFCSIMTSDEIKEQIKGKHRAFCIGEKFGTIGFSCLGEDIEITTFREEEYATHSRKPSVTFGKDILKDLSRRDFTINSMCIDVTKLINVVNRKNEKRTS